MFLGAGAVEYIICHAEISITFVEETKIAEVSNHFHFTQMIVLKVLSFCLLCFLFFSVDEEIIIWLQICF